MPRRPREPVKLRHDERVAFAAVVERRLQLRSRGDRKSAPRRFCDSLLPVGHAVGLRDLLAVRWSRSGHTRPRVRLAASPYAPPKCPLTSRGLSQSRPKVNRDSFRHHWRRVRTCPLKLALLGVVLRAKAPSD